MILFRVFPPEYSPLVLHTKCTDCTCKLDAIVLALLERVDCTSIHLAELLYTSKPYVMIKQIIKRDLLFKKDYEMKKRDKKKKNWSVQPLLLPTHLSGLPSLFICKCMVYY